MDGNVQLAHPSHSDSTGAIHLSSLTLSKDEGGTPRFHCTIEMLKENPKPLPCLQSRAAKVPGLMPQGKDKGRAALLALISKSSALGR